MNSANISIVHVVNSLAYAGAELFVARLACLQSKLGADVNVIVLGEANSSIINDLLENDVKVIILNNEKLVGIICFNSLIRALAKLEARIIHAHLFPSQYYVSLIKLFNSKDRHYVTTEHSTSNRRRDYLFFRLLEKFIYSNFDIVYCISGPVQDALVEWVPNIQQSTIVIENGIDLNSIVLSKPTDIATIPGLRIPFALCVGRLAPEKGQQFAIMAMKHHPDLDLLLIGDGVEKKNLLSLASELGVENRIYFLPTRPDVYSFMKACSVYIQPSLWEGFGLAALEAIACGAKVVCSDVPGMKDLLVPLGASSFECADPDDLARKIEAALLVETLYSLHNFPDRYSMSTTAINYIKSYSSLMDNHCELS